MEQRTAHKLMRQCQWQASMLVASYRSLAPRGYDPQAKGGSPSPPPPPLPPAPSNAADNKTMRERMERLRRARGYESTILTSGLNSQPSQPKSFLSNLLGG